MTVEESNSPTPLSNPEIEVYPGGDKLSSYYPRQLRVVDCELRVCVVCYEYGTLMMTYIPENTTPPAPKRVWLCSCTGYIKLH